MLSLPSLLSPTETLPLWLVFTKSWVWPGEWGFGGMGRKGHASSSRPGLFPRTHCSSSCSRSLHCPIWVGQSCHSTETERLLCAWAVLGPGATAMNRTNVPCPFGRKHKKGKPFWGAPVKNYRVESEGRCQFSLTSEQRLEEGEEASSQVEGTASAKTGRRVPGPYGELRGGPCDELAE